MHQKCQSHLLSSVSESSSLHRERTWHVAPCYPWELPWGKINTKPLKERHRCVLTVIFFSSIRGSRMLPKNGTLKKVLSTEIMSKKEWQRSESDKAPAQSCPSPLVRGNNKCGDIPSPTIETWFNLGLSASETWVSCMAGGLVTAGRFFTNWATRKAPL